MIEFIRWENKYSVGIESIDQQHRMIVSMINEFYIAFMSGRGEDVMSEIITKMIDYSQYHFRYEETYFHQFNYPETQSHIQEHEHFTTKTLEFKRFYDNDNSSITFRVVHFLKDWLATHIEGSDSKYKDCFIQNGLK